MALSSLLVVQVWAYRSLENPDGPMVDILKG